MVSLQETDPVPLHYHHSDRFTQYHTRDDVEVSPSRGTMEREEPSVAEQEPKVISVQERIRALNRNAGLDVSKPSLPISLPTKQRAPSPWQVKAASAPVARSKASTNSLSMQHAIQVQSGEIERQKSAEHPQVDSFSQSHHISNNIEELPNAEIEYGDNIRDGQLDVSMAIGQDVSTDGESHSSDLIVGRAVEFANVAQNPQANRGYSNTLHKFIIDSAQVGDDHQIEEFDNDIEEDFGASAAVQYWRRSRGTSNQEDDSAPNGDGDHRDDLQESSERQESRVLSSPDSHCGGDSHDLSLCPKLDSQEVGSQQVTSAGTDECTVEGQPDMSTHLINEVQAAVVSLELGAENDSEGRTLLTDDARATTSSPAQSQSSQPPSSHSALRTVRISSNLDDSEETSGEAACESGEVDLIEISEKHERRGSECESKEKPRRHSNSAPASSLSQRAFEKRSRIRATQSAQTVISKAKETPQDSGSTAEIDSASVFSGSTTHSSTTIHTTTLSSRATRLLRDKRKGNVKTDGLAKSLAQKILRGNTSKKSSSESCVNSHKEDGAKHNSPSCLTCSIEPKSVDVERELSDKTGVLREETHNSCREVGAISMPGIHGDYNSSHHIIASPVDCHFQRQISHVSQQSNPIQFGSSQSFQNVDQMQYPLPHYINPVPATPLVAYPIADPRLYGPLRIAPMNDLLVQPKFSRYNSFDVLNPKPPAIQNVLTEDSASWSESRTQDSAGGTQNTPQESIGPESLGQESDSFQPSSLDSFAQLDSFPKGRSFDKGCTVFDHIQNACDALSPRSCNPEIVSNPTIQSSDLIHAGSTFSNTLSDEDVAIEVEYVEQSEEQNVDVNSMESDSVYSLSTRDMDSRDSFSLDNA